MMAEVETATIYSNININSPLTIIFYSTKLLLLITALGGRNKLPRFYLFIYRER